MNEPISIEELNEFVNSLFQVKNLPETVLKILKVLQRKQVTTQMLQESRIETIIDKVTNQFISPK